MKVWLLTWRALGKQETFRQCRGLFTGILHMTSPRRKRGNFLRTVGKQANFQFIWTKALALPAWKHDSLRKLPKWTRTICLSRKAAPPTLTVCNLPQYTSKEPMEEAFCVWPGGGLWSQRMTEESSQGEALMRFQEVGCSEAPDASKAPRYPHSTPPPTPTTVTLEPRDLMKTSFRRSWSEKT